MKTRTTVDVGGVLHTGRELEIREAFELPEFSSYRFPEPVSVALLISRVGGGLEIAGRIAGTAGGECARCLDPIRHPFDFELDERFDANGGAEDPLGESNVLVGDELDVHDLVRQSIDSALPMVLLCGDDCPGLCPTCGRKRDGGCSHVQPE